MEVKAILFDMDGILMDSEYYYMHGTVQWMKELGYNKDEKALANPEDDFDPMAQMNKNMNLMFPIMYVTVALMAPLGLALYWLISNILMIIERLVLDKAIKD